jgi:hypothetical protein
MTRLQATLAAVVAVLGGVALGGVGLVESLGANLAPCSGSTCDQQASDASAWSFLIVVGIALAIAGTIAFVAILRSPR